MAELFVSQKQIKIIKIIDFFFLEKGMILKNEVQARSLINEKKIFNYYLKNNKFFNERQFLIILRMNRNATYFKT